MNQKITLEEILAVMSSAGVIMMQEGMLVEVEVPIKVVGDIHGQYEVSKLATYEGAQNVPCAPKLLERI